MNDFVKANRWTIPAGIILFSLLVGLCQKYLRAPIVIHGGFTDSMKGKGHEANYKTFPMTLLSSFFSLFSMASVGPEGPLAFLRVTSRIFSLCRRFSHPVLFKIFSNEEMMNSETSKTLSIF
jgi:hypothetical protein